MKLYKCKGLGKGDISSGSSSSRRRRRYKYPSIHNTRDGTFPRASHSQLPLLCLPPLPTLSESPVLPLLLLLSPLSPSLSLPTLPAPSPYKTIRPIQFRYCISPPIYINTYFRNIFFSPPPPPILFFPFLIRP